MTGTDAPYPFHVCFSFDTEYFITNDTGKPRPGRQCQSDDNAEIIFRKNGCNGNHEACPGKSLKERHKALYGFIRQSPKIP